MSRDAGDLLEDALQLAPEARAERLLDSLDEQDDEGSEQEWRATIQRRMAELNSGKVSTVPWTDVRERLVPR